MALLTDIVTHTNELLLVDHFKDYCPNGLQIEGKTEVKKIVSGVTASQALIDEAIESEADAVLVHHGFFWRGEKEVLTGLKRKRIASLINNNVSLLAYHLPLDAHAVLGNNAQLASKLDLKVVGNFGPGKTPLGVLAVPEIKLNRASFEKNMADVLGRRPTVLARDALKEYSLIAVCTGAAQSYFEQAVDAGADVFVTGEVSEQNYHIAMESGVDFFSSGHHATERYGVQALGDYLSKQFNIAHEYREILNPV